MAYRKDIPSPIQGSSFLIIFTHAQIGQDMSPVMAVCGKKSRSSYLIPLANAYQYADSISGEPTDQLMLTVSTIISALHLSDDRFTAYELTSAIVDALPMLVEMPPAPAETAKDIERKAERAGAIVSINGQKILDAS